MALTDRESHFEFGQNWARYAEGVTDAHLARAVTALAKLVGSDLSGKSFLEIGCGSGIHSLAALRLGAAPIAAFDIDDLAVATARMLLAKVCTRAGWRVEHRSIFDIPPASLQHDIVYSWGVLHHTGDMWRALERAASLVKPGGLLAIALYRKTAFCRFWRAEKRLFAHGPRWYRWVAERTYAGLYLGAIAVTGRSPHRYVKEYDNARGMSFGTDIRDWLGGYPYESAAPQEVRRTLEDLGFAEERFFPCNTRLGAFGVGCDEYVFRRGTSGISASKV